MSQYITQNRQQALMEWLHETIDDTSIQLQALAGDASFRHYYRLQHHQPACIVMDSPPENEPLGPFLKAAATLSDCGVHIPKIFATNQQFGFALLEDFGDSLLLSQSQSIHRDVLYAYSIQQLFFLQQYVIEPHCPFPAFNESFMIAEMELCRTWFFERYLKLSLTTQQNAFLSEAFQYLAAQIDKQKKVLIHRDFHSRNLMVLPTTNLGIGVIDFQDAMIGPYCYDLVSLLKDCYIDWPSEQQKIWLEYFHQNAVSAKLCSFEQLHFDYQLCGLQRHIKVLGVFARLSLRDGKSGYLKDLPLTLKHVVNCLQEIKILPELYQLFERIELP